MEFAASARKHGVSEEDALHAVENAMKTTSKQSVEEWLDSLDPSTMVVRDGRHMREISAARTALEAAETRLHDAVADAIAAGDSWGMIGVALGTSRQAAHRKFARLVRPAEASPTRSGEQELPD